MSIVRGAIGAIVAIQVIATSAMGQGSDAPASPLPPSGLFGTWTVELRLDDKDASYTKPMILALGAGGEVTGEFYDSAIAGGRFSKRGDRECVAFQTGDNSGPYFHSACLKGDRVEGMSWSTGRKFLLLWTAERSK